MLLPPSSLHPSPERQLPPTAGQASSSVEPTPHCSWNTASTTSLPASTFEPTLREQLPPTAAQVSHPSWNTASTTSFPANNFQPSPEFFLPPTAGRVSDALSSHESHCPWTTSSAVFFPASTLRPSQDCQRPQLRAAATSTPMQLLGTSLQPSRASHQVEQVPSQDVQDSRQNPPASSSWWPSFMWSSGSSSSDVQAAAASTVNESYKAPSKGILDSALVVKNTFIDYADTSTGRARRSRSWGGPSTTSKTLLRSFGNDSFARPVTTDGSSSGKLIGADSTGVHPQNLSDQEAPQKLSEPENQRRLPSQSALQRRRHTWATKDVHKERELESQEVPYDSVRFGWSDHQAEDAPPEETDSPGEGGEQGHQDAAGTEENLPKPARKKRHRVRARVRPCKATRQECKRMVEMLGKTYESNSAGEDPFPQRLVLCQKLAAQSAVPPYMSRVLRAVAPELDEASFKTAPGAQAPEEDGAEDSSTAAATQPISKRQARRLLQKQIEDGYLAKFGKAPDDLAKRNTSQSRPAQAAQAAQIAQAAQVAQAGGSQCDQ
eukprot:TRINITY_DN23165_c0_g1_i2.p1 TRINITY_DN23165_c0_g1~~TRINITY_DN23165_c0_g1_i2.p1  ORF type:complete len:549 (-),score=101.94 TRINITY_DN23165_c0_g1_i2:728-2374(-)